MGAKSKVKRRKQGENAPEPPPSFEPEISSFLVWVQLEKGLSPNTVNSYERDLIQCSLHLKTQGISDWQGAGFLFEHRQIFDRQILFRTGKFLEDFRKSAGPIRPGRSRLPAGCGAPAAPPVGPAKDFLFFHANFDEHILSRGSKFWTNFRVIARTAEAACSCARGPEFRGSADLHCSVCGMLGTDTTLHWGRRTHRGPQCKPRPALLVVSEVVPGHL